MASISLGVFVSSSLIVIPALLVAHSADPGKRKVSPLKTIVVCFTLSSGKVFPSCIASDEIPSALKPVQVRLWCRSPALGRCMP